MRSTGLISLQAPIVDKENVPHAAAPPLKPLPLAPYHCYWLSLAEMVEGQATTQLINPARQSPAAQDALRVKALERFLEGVRWGGKAGRTDLVRKGSRNLNGQSLVCKHLRQRS